jgi:hypothetical protein
MDFSKSKIKHLIIHEIGNKLRDEKVFLSTTLQSIEEDLESILLNYFLKSFLTQRDFYHFNHNTDLNLNEIYSYSKNIFHKNNETSFIENSQNIAKHLYEYSLHPKIARGELIIVQISNIGYDSELIDLIGIFKSENKDSFLKVIKEREVIKVKDDEGINISKLEKGCLVLNANKSNGYVVLNIDNNNQTTDYWTNKFLNLKPIDNDIHKTKEIMNLCKNFSNDILSGQYNTDIKFDFNNDYINYFEDNELYDIDNFTDSLFKDNKMKEDFFEYYQSNEEAFDFDMYDKFELSQSDIKKEKKKIKNIIKLDTKLELKVLLDKDNGTKNIEKGFDEDKGMHFYKIYFNEEIK